MEYGERVYRQLYARGGLSDRLSAMTSGLRGLGDGESLVIPTQFLRSSAGSQTFLAQHPEVGRELTLPTGEAEADVGADAAAGAPDCACMVQNVEVDAATREQLAMLCAQDPNGFAQTLLSQGIGIDCMPPWYMQPRNLAIGAGVLVAGAVAWWALK